MINMAVKLLDHFKNALILPHKYVLMKLVVRYIKDYYKALECYNSIVQMNCKPRPELPLVTKDQLKIIADEITDYCYCNLECLKCNGILIISKA